MSTVQGPKLFDVATDGWPMYRVFAKRDDPAGRVLCGIGLHQGSKQQLVEGLLSRGGRWWCACGKRLWIGLDHPIEEHKVSSDNFDRWVASVSETVHQRSEAAATSTSTTASATTIAAARR